MILTVVTWLLAAWLAPRNDPSLILESWYKGTYDIASFAFLVASMLVTGYALSVSKPISRILSWLASLPRSDLEAISLTTSVVIVVSLLHWAVGLTVAGLLSRALARRRQIDIAWLAAAAYSGFGLFSSGLSCSVQLISAMRGSPLNIVEKVTGSVLPLSATVLAACNVVPVLILSLIIPLTLYMLRPRSLQRSVPVDDREREAVVEGSRSPSGLVGRMEHTIWINLAIAAAFTAAFVHQMVEGRFSLDFTSMIALFFAAGLLLHGSPRAYIQAFTHAARHAGGVLLQFPLYGGIMGVMLATGLAEVIAKAFTAVASPATLPFWSFLSSIVISIFVPSAGGLWAVQGSFIVPVAQALHASQAATIMGVAMGEGTADMIQPMWALPLLAITGATLPRLLRYTLLSFTLMVVVFGLSLLLLAPHT